MALDQQRNWDISMAENLEAVKRRSKENKESVSQQATIQEVKHRNEDGDEVYTTWTNRPVYLPDEIILEILSYVAASKQAQKTLASCCLLSRQWYDAAVPILYAYPYLYGGNFDQFVRAVCPSINLHVRKSPLSELVKSLNMSGLVHQGSRSLTARLLGRTKNQLEEFVAPQASFAENCFPALSKSHRLRTLDLSLVSESPALPLLFKTVAHLTNLRTFRLPRSAGFGAHYNPSTPFAWPPGLENLSLSGGIDAHFLHGVVSFPQTLRSLTIEHCPLAKGFAVTHLLRTAVRPLRNLVHFKIRMMPRLGSHALDHLLALLPQVKRLSVSVDYITPALFDAGHLSLLQKDLSLPLPPTNPSADPQQDTPDLTPSLTTPTDSPTPQHHDDVPSLAHPNLHHLELTNSGNPGVEDKISPIDILIAIDEGIVPQLRQVRVARSLLWHAASTAADAEALADALQEGSKRDWDAGRGRGEGEVFAGCGGTERGEREKVWERVAGVWMFDGA
ncbi:hypothetical protein KC365_g242 [Hortaea werneckii]|nr:hypothetical protein KC342_g967 [Hortaea werneckii]KAI7108859.1 hypothetical protein KC339_g1219 [Hortaea werneckii]KAI7245732.1 hypothetical protein KC365_g242 [Hortaea werneckii]KAI7390128.1 hypothetical protein KC328_g8100 [Hortaea werneckii]